MFTKLYLDTTQPGQNPRKLLQDQRVYTSALVHTVFYMVLVVVIASVFKIKKIDMLNLFILSMTIQVLGYPARAWHVNEIYKTYGDNFEAARAHIDKQYITWFFIG